MIRGTERDTDYELDQSPQMEEEEEKENWTMKVGKTGEFAEMAG
jgi:hypothetical protein